MTHRYVKISQKTFLLKDVHFFNMNPAVIRAIQLNHGWASRVITHLRSTIYYQAHDPATQSRPPAKMRESIKKI
jgi:hypothetical protein